MNGFLWHFQSSVAIYAGMEYKRIEAGSRTLRWFIKDYSLIAGMEGKGSVLIDGKRCRLGKGSCLLATPGSLVEIENTGSEGFMFYRLSFRVDGITPPQGEEREESPLVLRAVLHVQPFGLWADKLHDLYRHRLQRSGLEGYRQHLRLQELLYELCERSAALPKNDPRIIVCETIDGLHADSARSVTVSQLAARAKMAIGQYTYHFKELTGQSPMDYITTLRMNEAKKQLLLSNDHLITIASNAGFQDVYYFSRRFKQMEGMSPRHYVAKRRRELRIVALYYAGILMSIGVKPVGANLAWWGGSDFLREQEADVVDVGALPSLETIAELEPDLILLNDTHETYYRQFSKIAPSVVIPYDGKRNVYEDMRLIGGLVDNEEAAEQFIARYERKAEAARAKIAAAGISGSGKQAAIIRLEEAGSSFSVFGDNYGRCGWAVYRGLGLGAPIKVRQLIDSGTQIEQKMPIALLPEYVGSVDYLFVVNEGEGIERIAGNSVWKGIGAVIRGRAFELNQQRFSYFDPISLEAQLELLTEMLLERGA